MNEARSTECFDNFFPNVRKGSQPFVASLIGAKDSGKTSLLMDLLKTVWKQVFNLIIIVSPTFFLQNLSDEITDGTNILIIPEFKLSIIEELEILQREKKDQKKQIESTPKEFVGALANVKIPEDHHVLLIFDDIGSLGKEGKLSVQMANLACIVRHYNVSIIELAQRITLLSTAVSSQADLWIFFCEQNPNERINIWRRIGFYENKKLWWEIFDRETREVRSWIGIRKIHGRNFFFNQNGFIDK